MICYYNQIPTVNKKELTSLEAEVGKITNFGGSVDRPGELSEECDPSRAEEIHMSGTTSVFS